MKRSKEKYLTSKSKVISFKFRFSKKMFCFSSLEQRKEQLRKQNEELIKSMPDPDQPPGHRKLPDEEKEKTLSLLQESEFKYET